MRYRLLLFVWCLVVVSASTPAVSLAQGLLPSTQYTDHWAIDSVPSLQGDAVRAPDLPAALLDEYSDASTPADASSYASTLSDHNDSDAGANAAADMDAGGHDDNAHNPGLVVDEGLRLPPTVPLDVQQQPSLTNDAPTYQAQPVSREAQPADHDVVEMNEGDIKLVTPALVDEVKRVQLYVRDTALYVDADIDFALSDELRDAAYKGVPLHFTADIEIAQPRSWWFDKKIVKESQTWRVVYNALTRQWRVGAGEILVPESSLADALLSIQHLRGWAIAPADEFSLQKRYYGRIRLRLDTSFFNRPFQVDAMNSHVWSLATPWKDFDFSISDGEPLP